jgi:2-amino-4-hydroxy-6-hydroxymethyldihydropteridine diphosphokinase
METARHHVLISVGTNYRRVQNIRDGLSALRAEFEVTEVSAWYVSAAVDLDAALFWNGMVALRTNLDRDALKRRLQVVEDRTGRVRRGEQGKRFKAVSLDLDIAAFNGEVTESKLFTLPYLVVPLADLAPLWVDPQSGHTARYLAWRCSEQVIRIPDPSLAFEHLA